MASPIIHRKITVPFPLAVAPLHSHQNLFLHLVFVAKTKTELRWEPSFTVEEGLRKTVEWYLTNQDWWQPLLSPAYQEYYQKAYG